MYHVDTGIINSPFQIYENKSATLQTPITRYGILTEGVKKNNKFYCNTKTIFIKYALKKTYTTVVRKIFKGRILTLANTLCTKINFHALAIETKVTRLFILTMTSLGHICEYWVP